MTFVRICLLISLVWLTAHSLEVAGAPAPTPKAKAKEKAILPHRCLVKWNTLRYRGTFWSDGTYQLTPVAGYSHYHWEGRWRLEGSLLYLWERYGKGRSEDLFRIRFERGWNGVFFDEDGKTWGRFSLVEE